MCSAIRSRFRGITKLPARPIAPIESEAELEWHLCASPLFGLLFCRSRGRKSTFGNYYTTVAGKIKRFAYSPREFVRGVLHGSGCSSCSRPPQTWPAFSREENLAH